MSASLRQAVVADTVFDGASVRRDAAVVIEGSQIAAVVPRVELPATISMRRMPDGVWLAPGFIDIQVNGGGDVLFNDDPTVERIRAIAAAHRRFGTTALLPTLITDAPEKMKSALAAFERVAASEASVIGIHLEGPFISPGKAGVHEPRYIRAPTDDDLALLLKPRSGVTVITLAPEEVPGNFVQKLADAGVRVCLGHSMATYEETRIAIANGVTGFTHLFNAMRPLEVREPGPVAAVLESPNVWFGMIVDGIHVSPAMLRLALRSQARPMLVTDAMPPVGGDRSSFKLYGQDISVCDGRCVRSDGTLAGAALDMASAVRNCVRLLDLPLEAALRFAAANPADFLGLGGGLGRIAPGYRADLVALEPEAVTVMETWVAGHGLAAG